MNVDWTVMRDRRSPIRWPSSLTHLPNQHLLLPVPRVRVANEMLLLVKLPMMVRPNGLEVGLRVAKIGWKTDQLMMSPEHDCPKCLMGMMTTGYWNRLWELEHTLMLYIGFLSCSAPCFLTDLSSQFLNNFSFAFFVFFFSLNSHSLTYLRFQLWTFLYCACI